MAGLTGLLSAAAPLLALNFLNAQDVKARVEASTSLALSLAQVAVSAPRAAAESVSASSTAIKPLATLAVATLASRNSTAAGAGTLSINPTPVAQPIPPQVIVETNYITYTKVKTVAPSYITVTQTVQPPTLPPPPSPPTPPEQAQPNAVPVANPDPLVIPSSISTPSPTSTRTPEVAAASSSLPLPPPAPPILATPANTPLLSFSSAPPPPLPAAAAPATTLLGTAELPTAPVLAPIMSASGPERGGSPSLNPNPQAQTGPPGGPPMGPPDPANGAFPGGVPTKSLDLPLTIMFMMLFMLGAYVHITIYRRNAKRGHKFLISDIVFQFCMIRTVTCIFRITWSIVTTRGVVLMALITENSGAALIFAVNIFFAQRLVRSIHPKAGWCTAFGQFTFILLISVPVFVLLNLISTIVSFFSVGNADRLEVTDILVKFGSSWNMWLAVFPVLVVSGSLSVPGPKPEKFGSGSQRVKVALLYLGAFLMMTGQTIRLYTLFNKEPPGTTSIIYSKAVFYTTGFMFELLVVALYAIMRVDQRFHIPNGSSGPGDYSDDQKRGQYSVEEIEQLIDDLGVPHQIMRERKGPEDMEMLFTIFFATKKNDKDNEKEKSELGSDETTAGSNIKDAALPERPKRITRRQTIIDAVKPPPRSSRMPSVYPDIAGMYGQMDGGEYPPTRPQRPSMYSRFGTGQDYYDARYQKYWDGASPPYGNEKGGQ